MTPPGIVPAFNPGKYCQAGPGTGFEGLAIDQFALKAGEETLRHGMIKRITDRFPWKAAHPFGGSDCRRPGWYIGSPDRYDE